MTHHQAQSTDGTIIAYQEDGSGPTLVLVGGALAHRNSPFAKPIRDALAKSFKVIDYDRRGRGDSGDKPTYTVESEIEDLQAILKAVGGGRVFGMSSGAALALEAAAAGTPMDQLVVYEPPYIATATKGAPDPDYTERVQAYIEAGDRNGAVRYFMKTVGVPGFMLPIMRIMPMWKGLREVAHTLPYDGTILNRFVVPLKRLASIDAPTTVMYGGKTTPAIKDAAKDVATAVPACSLQEIVGQTHAIKPAALHLALLEAIA